MTRPSDREREELERPAQPVAGNPGEPQPEASAAPGLPAGAEATPEQQMRAVLEEAQRERDQFRSLAMRSQADLANYRKRVDDEREQLQRAAGAQLLVRLFPILDDFGRAIEQAPRGQPWVEGVQIIEKKFQAFLDAAGVQRIDPIGKAFDPWEHEVVAYQEASGHPDGTVIAVVASGYKMSGKMLQPARVVVAKASGKNAPSTSNTGSSEA